jgi:CheY-like chemotaxis protein
MPESKKLLLVEDEDDIRESLTLLLELRGYKVDSAANGREALSVIRKNSLPCMVILDLNMPLMDGWQLREVMLRDPELSEVPVVIVSGVGKHKTATQLAAVGHFTKPVDLKTLFALLEQHCKSEV